MELTVGCATRSSTASRYADLSETAVVLGDKLGKAFDNPTWHQKEEVARLHLGKLGMKLTTLSKEQADYIGVPVEGPYKSAHYRY